MYEILYIQHFITLQTAQQFHEQQFFLNIRHLYEQVNS